MGFVYKKGQTSYSSGGNKSKGSSRPGGGGPHGSNKKGKGPSRSQQRIKPKSSTPTGTNRPGYGGSKTDKKGVNISTYTPKSGSDKSGSDIGKEIDRAIADRQKNTGIFANVKDKVMNTIMNQGDYVSDPNALNKKTWLKANPNLGGQHKLRTQFDRLRAKYGPGWEKTEQAKVLANYLSGVAVERGGGLGARTDETDEELIGPTNWEDIPAYDPITGEFRTEAERKSLAEAALAREKALNEFAGMGIGSLEAAETGIPKDYLKGLDPKQLRLGLNPDQYFQFRQQLMAADPTPGNMTYKGAFPWSSGYMPSKLATPIWSMAKGALGIEDKTPEEWADWRANQQIFKDTSTPVYGQDNQNQWNTGEISQPVEDPDEDEDEEDVVDLTPTPTPFPTYGTGIAGLDWASLAPQFGPQYPGHYSNQGIQPNFANWYNNLNKYYGYS